MFKYKYTAAIAWPTPDQNQVAWPIALQKYKVHYQGDWAEKTLKNSARRVEIFGAWAMTWKECTSPCLVTAEDAIVYLLLEKKRGLKPGTIRTIVCALKTFFAELKRLGITDEDCMSDIPYPPQTKYLPKPLTEKECKDMMECKCMASRTYYRNKAILGLLYSSALRVSELSNALLENYDAVNGIIQVTGKGNKTRRVSVGRKAREAIARYLRKERTKLCKGQDVRELFVTQRRRKVCTNWILRIVKVAAKAAGIISNVYPHRLRHSCATHLLKNGADLRVIQEILGHEQLTTTLNYAELDISKLSEAVKSFHPSYNSNTIQF